MKYKVIKRCFFEKRLWEKDEIVEFPGGKTLPSHFVPVDNIAPEMPVYDPMKPQTQEPGQPRPRGGFASAMSSSAPKKDINEVMAAKKAEEAAEEKNAEEAAEDKAEEPVEEAVEEKPTEETVESVEKKPRGRRKTKNK